MWKLQRSGLERLTGLFQALFFKYVGSICVALSVLPEKRQLDA